MTDVLATADGADKAALYKQLGVSLTYHHERRVTVEALLTFPRLCGHST